MLDPYLTTPRLIADLDRWSLDTIGPGTVIERPDEAFWTALPDEAKASFERFVAALESGRFPAGIDFHPQLGAPSFPLAEDDEDVFQLAADGGGNYWCLAGEGEVVCWNHEESEIEGHSVFASIDELVWALVRYRAALDEALPLEEAIEAFAEADEDTGIGWLREMLEDEL